MNTDLDSALVNERLRTVPDPRNNLYVIVDAKHGWINWERGNVALEHYIFLGIALVMATSLTQYLLAESSPESLGWAIAVGLILIPLAMFLEIVWKLQKCKSKGCSSELKPSVNSGFGDMCGSALKPETARDLAMLYMETRYKHFVDSSWHVYCDDRMVHELEWLYKTSRRQA